jgi:2-polyprenyl-6-methoxyphenol hydroxylase-like FAD-dependent oxidoreductase
MASTLFHRADLMQSLFESLGEADRSRILTDKKVVDIKSDASGVEAICGDGSVYHGSIIIGADGVHSRVRQAMRALALLSSTANNNDERPFVSTYRAMWFSFPIQPKSAPGDIFESHGTDVSAQFMTGDTRSWTFVYEKLKTPTQDRISYSDEDVKEMANLWGDIYISSNLQVKDVFPKRHTAGMANLEEGVVKHWSWSNLVLVGDACHKFTPNQGLGFNFGIQDVVVLVNELHQSLAANGGRSPDAKSLAAILTRYQASRMKPTLKDYDQSAGLTRMAAWGGWLYWLLDRYVFSSIPSFDDFLVTHVLGGPISSSFVLNFAEAYEPFQGQIPWKYPLIAPSTNVRP